MNEEIREVIQATVDETVLKLKKAGLMKDNEKSASKKTEEILKICKDLKAAKPEVGSPTEIILKKVDEALETLEGDDYSELIRMLYFDGVSREEAAEYFEVEPITITRNKRRLIEKIKNIVFADDVIKELFL